MNIAGLIKTMPGYIGSTGRAERDITSAENQLCCTFAKDYHDYLKEIGLASFDGHELTGLTKTARLDVVSISIEQRQNFDNTVSSWYVVEEIGLDGIVIWQASSGEIYQTVPGKTCKKIYDSLADYLINTSK